MLKRDHVGQLFDGFDIRECGNGIIGSRANGKPGNQGKGTRVRNGVIRRTQGRPLLLYGADVSVQNVVVEDFGVWISDPQTVTAVARGNGVAGVDLRGCVGAQVAGNRIAITDRTADDSEKSRRRIGIALRRDDVGAGSADCRIADNAIACLDPAIFEDDASQGNDIANNRVDACG